MIVLLGESNTTNLLVLMVVQFLLYEFVNIFFVNLPSRSTSLQGIRLDKSFGFEEKSSSTKRVTKESIGRPV